MSWIFMCSCRHNLTTRFDYNIKILQHKIRACIRQAGISEPSASTELTEPHYVIGLICIIYRGLRWNILVLGKRLKVPSTFCGNLLILQPDTRGQKKYFGFTSDVLPSHMSNIHPVLLNMCTTGEHSFWSSIGLAPKNTTLYIFFPHSVTQNLLHAV